MSSLTDRYDSAVKMMHKLDAYRNVLNKQKYDLQKVIAEKEHRDLVLSKVIALYGVISAQQRDLLGENLEKIVTYGLKTVFNDGVYEFCVEIGTRGDYPTMNLFVLDKGKERDIMNGDGGGLANVCGFLLQILYVCLLGDRIRKFIVMDEALNNLSGGHRDNMGQLIRELCDKLDFQILFITHQHEYRDYGDVVYDLALDEHRHTKATKILQ